MNKLAQEFKFVLTSYPFVPDDLFTRCKVGVYMDRDPFHREKRLREAVVACVDEGQRPAVVVSRADEFVIYVKNNKCDETEATDDDDNKQQRVEQLEKEVAELESEIRQMKGARKRTASELYREPESVPFNLADELQCRINTIDEEVNITDADLRDVIGGLVMQHGLGSDIVANVKMRVPPPKQILRGKNPSAAECARIGNALLNLLELPITTHAKISMNERVKKILHNTGDKRVRTSDDGASSNASAQNNQTSC